MRFKGLDLNLLVALDILLAESSVSRAAERLHISQPAASAALGRLRDYFGDELLIQHGKRMIPTSYADSLAPEIRRILGQVDSIIQMSSEFDPPSSKRVFRLMASDYIAAVLIGPAIKRLAEVAPDIQLDIRLPSERVGIEFERGEIDLVLTPEEYISPNHPAELLFEEQHVVVGWEENALLGTATDKGRIFGQRSRGCHYRARSAIDLRGTPFAVPGTRQDGRDLCAVVFGRALAAHRDPAPDRNA